MRRPRKAIATAALAIVLGGCIINGTTLEGCTRISGVYLGGGACYVDVS